MSLISHEHKKIVESCRNKKTSPLHKGAFERKWDFEEGTEEHREAVERTDMWFALSDRLRNMIFDILKHEGVEIPDKGQIVVLEPFMKRNGFIDGNGWWTKE